MSLFGRHHWSRTGGTGREDAQAGTGAPTVSVKDGLAAKGDLLWVADRWPDLRARLRPQGATKLGGSKPGIPSSRPPLDIHVSDLMFEIEEHARFLGKVLLEETNDWEPTTSAMPQLLREVAERYGHFIVGDDKTALDFCDEAHEFRRKVTHSLEKPPAPTYMGGFLPIGCSRCQHTTEEDS